MISNDKLDAAADFPDSSTANIAKQYKLSEQPHIGKYKLLKTIGKGNFAKVKLAQHVTTGIQVAVKVIDKTALNHSSLEKLQREVKIMKALEHPNIVKLFEVIESDRHTYLVMEYASRGEVFDYIVQNGRMKEKDARQKFRQIVSAIQYCHQQNIVHRDLKAENLLLSSNLDIKIADFGFANTFDSKKQLDTFCGSPPYAAPELFQGRKYDGPEVDVWSLGVILYTLVSGSLPFDGNNMRELRDRVLKGKYRVPFYMTNDCEQLIKRMLVVNPQKRYTLLEVMKDKWINIGYEDSILHPYKEPAKNFEDPIRIAMMENLGFTKEDILDSLYNSKFNNITSTYLLLGYEVNNGLANSSKSASVNSLKNINSHLSPKDATKVAMPGNDKSTKAVTRSGSAIEARLNTNVATNGDGKDSHYVTQNENQEPIDADGEINHTEKFLKVKPGKAPSTIKQSPSMGTTNTYSNDEVPQLVTAPLRSRNNQIRIPGIQPRNGSIAPHAPEDVPEMDNGDNLLMPGKFNNLVKRNNTFTYADKNTASGVESKPVTRAKHVMNMLSQATPSTTPLNVEESMNNDLNNYGSNDVILSDSKTEDSSHNAEGEMLNGTIMSESGTEEVIIKINDQPTATGDQINTNTQSSGVLDKDALISTVETVHNIETQPLEPMNHIPVVVDTSVTSSKDATEPYPQLNRPKQMHSNSLFRSLTNRMSTRPRVTQATDIKEPEENRDSKEINQHNRRYSTGDKLMRRLTSHHGSSNRNKRTSDYTADPWTPMDTTVLSNDNRAQISASFEVTGGHKQSMDKGNFGNQSKAQKHHKSKPRIMHLVFRKNFVSKLPPDTTISEILKSLGTTDEIEFKKIEQIDPFVIDCQARLKSEGGGHELIHWEIEVFRLPRSSTSYGVRLKKLLGSSTRFKAIQKLLTNKLSPILCTRESSQQPPPV